MIYIFLKTKFTVASEIEIDNEVVNFAESNKIKIVEIQIEDKLLIKVDNVFSR